MAFEADPFESAGAEGVGVVDSSAIPVPPAVVGAAVQNQVAAYDARFRKGLEDSRAARGRASESVAAQQQAFGRRDATGVEAVHDVMPTEREAFEALLAEAAASEEIVAHGGPGANGARAAPVHVLDFGCGDGRYLQQFLRSAETLWQRHGRELHVLAYEVSVEALRSFHFHATQADLSPEAGEEGEGVKRAKHEEAGDGRRPGLAPLLGRHLRLEFLCGDGEASAAQVAALLGAGGRVYDGVVIGWGTLSSIPRLPSLSPESLLAALAGIGRRLMNVVSTTNNHVKFQRQCEARRRAYAETTNVALRRWLEPRIGLATFPRSYYYRVDTGELMFYAAVTADEEVNRLRSAGFRDVRLRICNVINFFDIQTKPCAARINAAVIRLLDRGDVWGAQLLLSRCVAKAFCRPLSDLRTSSCIFDGSSKNAVFGQVARYFISTGASSSFLQNGS